MESNYRIASMLDNASDLTIDAAHSASAGRASKTGLSGRDIPFTQLQKLIDSRSDRDVLEGLRKVVSMIYQGKPCLPFFSSVVKTVMNPNIEIKKLVYVYLLHYAESDPDLALLSVNAIQKALTNSNPQVRAMALRTMSGMRVPVISQIVSLAIKRGCADTSPLVRKASALAIPKCYRLDSTTLPQLLDHLSTLLGDKQYFVVGPAVSAFLEICPDRIDLIHKHYRGLVRKLVDMDEWSQLATLQVLLRYSRRCFPRRKKRVTTTPDRGFYGDEPAETVETGEEVLIVDHDLELLLKACKPLLQSRNSAVIVSAVSCLLYLGTPDHLRDAAGPLIALLRGPSDIQQVSLYNIVSTALMSPQLFAPYASHFLIRAADPPVVWRLKLELLTIIFPHCDLHSKNVILYELEHFAQGTSLDLVRESFRAIGRCAQSEPRTSSRCFRILLRQISDNSKNVPLVSEALTVIRHLIQQDPDSHRGTVIRLAKNLDMTTSPEARASIIWLVGEFAGIDPENNIAPDVLRILASGFSEESEAAKQQILLLAAKVYLLYLNRLPSPSPPPSDQDPPSPDPFPNDKAPPSQPDEEQDSPTHPIPQLWQYILLLTRYDTSYDLRDRARLFKSLLQPPLASTHLASLLLLAPKPVPAAPSPSELHRDLLLGTSSLILGRSITGPTGMNGYNALPDWVEQGREPDAQLRGVDGAESGDTDGAESGGGFAKTGKGGAAGRMLDEALRREKIKNPNLGQGQGLGLGRKSAGEPARVATMAGAPVDGDGKSKGKEKEKSLDAWLDESDDDADEDGSGGGRGRVDADSREEEEEEEEEEDTGSEEEESEDDDDDHDDDDDDDDENAGESGSSSQTGSEF